MQLIININFIFFGSLKSHFGESLKMSVTKGTDLEGLMSLLKQYKPGASDIIDTCLLAIDNEFERKSYKMVKSGEIAVLPPFSGG